MRLLNVNTLELSEFFEREIPRYGILSHRWGKDEVSYQDYVHDRKKDSSGYRKISEFCAFVKERKIWLDVNGNEVNLQWVWVDTCCIDKSSSAEISEAINSMYFWYSNAEECYIYMQDVQCHSQHSKSEDANTFQKSEWFKRGWTLQELLAPEMRLFCNSKWEIIGHIHRVIVSQPLPSMTSNLNEVFGIDLTSSVSGLTGIRGSYLDGSSSVQSASVACRMSWAAGRRTTRIEDTAYCLLGLFDVNMPLLYGEREKAFSRLQEEIIRRSDDQSIFVWEHDFRSGRGYYNVGLLANHINCFRASHRVCTTQARPDRPYSITNIGLRMEAKLRRPIADLDDPSCVPRTLELTGIFTRQEKENPISEQNASQRPSLRLFLLQCLHDGRPKWYRSRVNDIFTRGDVSDLLDIPFHPEQPEQKYVEIFASLFLTSSEQCSSCSRFDYGFEKLVKSWASQQCLPSSRAGCSSRDQPSMLLELP